MPDFSGTIKDFVAGDNLKITRTITNVPSADTLTKAWFTVKLRKEDSDADAVIQKEITTSDVSGTGHITDDATGDTEGAVRFDLEQADTVKLSGGAIYRYDIQVLTSAGAVYTPEIGKIIAQLGTTEDTS